MPTRRRLLPLFLLFFLLSSAPLTSGIRLGKWRTLLSLSHSLLSRIANSRAARGDLDGAARVAKIADYLRILDGGFWSLTWDFLFNYSLRGNGAGVDFPRAAVSRLLAALSEASRIKSGAEMADWVRRNYSSLLAISDSLLRGLLRTFSRSGPLREALLLLQREVEEGELLKDCLEVGARDLEGLLRIAKDLLFSHSASGFADGEL
ncbi:uncharacterized protein [Typha latifolia]|uniref:uncharacterized protein n=1 Tax=Typha latifolia TaxID=4733 RepID=UPI003C2EC28D